jgi:hypothetical protein
VYDAFQQATPSTKKFKFKTPKAILLSGLLVALQVLVLTHFFTVSELFFVLEGRGFRLVAWLRALGGIAIGLLTIYGVYRDWRHGIQFNRGYLPLIVIALLNLMALSLIVEIL